MRKASREMDATFALEVLDKAPYVTVSMTKSDGSPYGLPLSLVRTDEKTFYFHCALEGDKLDCIAHCPTVFLSAVTKCAPTVGPKDGSFIARSPENTHYLINKMRILRLSTAICSTMSAKLEVSMTVMTDDSFLNLRGKEILVYYIL